MYHAVFEFVLLQSYLRRLSLHFINWAEWLCAVIHMSRASYSVYAILLSYEMIMIRSRLQMPIYSAQHWEIVHPECKCLCVHVLRYGNLAQGKKSHCYVRTVHIKIMVA